MQGKASTRVSRLEVLLAVLLEHEAWDISLGCLLTYHELGRVSFCQHFQPIASCTKFMVEVEHILKLN